ncbi:MAG: PIN domain-containing protein [Rickettsiales bacterium]|nr:PIN domain-containing protein [Rickettsiales bacterium]
MIYLDTNVIVNSAINNIYKQKSLKLFLEVIEQGKFFSSYLLIQESLFVFNKLDIPKEARDFYIDVLLNHLKGYNFSKEFRRALDLYNKVKLKSTNDLFHFAIAESFCEELITFDKDFEKLKPFTSLKITIL